MGRYITTTSIYDTRIYGLSSSVVDATTVSLFIDDAEATVDSYIAKQYSLPLASVPPLIVKLSKDLTAYYVLEYVYAQRNQNVNEWVMGMGERAIGSLEDLSKDKVRLTYSAGTAVTMDININMATNMEGIPTIFNIDDDYDWRAPSTLLDSISDARSATD